jgi:TRAP-type mannitol/chloroaromatic compound transport system permease small subunit
MAEHTDFNGASRLIYCLDQLAVQTGKACSYAIPFMVVVTVVIVILRYGFSVGAVAAQESVTYLHAWLFLGAMAYGLKSDSHVRVDIFYRNFSDATRQWVNAIGGLVFLLPMCAALIYYGWDYAYRSWAIGETSVEPGGIPAVFLLKTLIPLAAVLLFIQCLAEVLANTLRLIAHPLERTPTRR